MTNIFCLIYSNNLIYITIISKIIKNLERFIENNEIVINFYLFL